MTALRERIPILLLLLLAAWLYWRVPLAVPPGLEMDELIEAEIAEQVLVGDWRPFYEAGQGREGLYYYWLAGWLAALGKGVFTLRLASTTVSLMGLAAVYVLARYLFGRSVAFLCLAYAAAAFWTLFAARSGLRSTSLLLIAALAGYFFCRGLGIGNWRLEIRGNRQSPISNLLLWGFLLGLSFYAYTAARVLPAVFLLVIVYLGLFHRPVLMARWRGVVLGAAVALLVALPFFLYLRANPAADQFEFLDFNRPLAALESGDPQPAAETTVATLGMFLVAGDPLMFDNVPGRPVFDRANGALFVAGVVVALWRWRRPAYAFVLVWLVVGLIPGMLSQPAPNFYRTALAQVVAFVFPALAVVEGGWWMVKRLGAVGASGDQSPPPPHPSPYQGEGVARPVFPLLSERKGLGERWRVVLVSVAAGLLLAVHLAGSWQGYFVDWPQVEGVRFFWQSNLAEVAQYLGKQEEGESAAICTVLTYEHDPWWRPAWRSMPYLLQRDGAAVRFYDCRTTLVQPGEMPAAYFFPDLPEPVGVIPAEFREEWWNGARRLGGVFRRPEGVAVMVEEMALALPPLATEVEWGPEAGGGTAGLPVRFGDSLALVGYRLDPDRPQPGAPIRLLTAWEVLATPPPRLALFTHVLSDPQTVIAQQDGLALTSHSLRPGDRFWVVHDQVVLPAGEVPAGGYLFAIGLYNTDTLARLPIVGNEGLLRGDRLLLPNASSLTAETEQESSLFICETSPMIFGISDQFGLRLASNMQFQGEEQVIIEAWQQDSSQLHTVELDLATQTAALLPFDSVPPLANPCTNNCRMVAFSQSPDSKWQLVQSGEGTGDPDGGIWLVGQNQLFQLASSVPYWMTWEWSVDSSLLWFVHSRLGFGNDVYAVELREPFLARYLNIGYPGPLDSSFYHVAFSPLHKTALSTAGVPGQRTPNNDELYHFDFSQSFSEPTLVETIPGIESVRWDPGIEDYLFTITRNDGWEVRSQTRDRGVILLWSAFADLWPETVVRAAYFHLAAISPSGKWLALYDGVYIYLFSCQ